MADKFNLEGFSVSEDNECTAEGGFVSDSLNSEGATLRIGNKSPTQNVSIVPDGFLSIGGEDTSEIIISGGAVSVVKIFSLPTSDPSAFGQLWNDSGTLKISAG